MSPYPLVLLTLTLLALSGTASPVGAADGPLFASYWNDFLEHWTGVFQKQNGVVMLALCIGAVCLFIITRGKWKK